MKKNLIERIEIPQEITCSYDNGEFECSRGTLSLKRHLHLSGISLKIDGGVIVLECEAGNKNEFKIMRSTVAHIHNIFKGLAQPFVYALESCNVHFPMTLKVEKDALVITNFLGEKVPRLAKILPGVSIELKGSKITLSSADREAAGQTAANIERATKIRNRDRRIFQDGIYIVTRPESGA